MRNLKPKSMRGALRIGCLYGLLCGAVFPYALQADSLSLLNQAKSANAERYQFAIDQRVEIQATKDNKAFSIWWQPSTSKPAAVIVTLHGHGSYATDEFFLWQKYANERSFAILALQWWFGGGETVSDYYTPQEMYPIIADILTTKEVAPGAVLFHGYSRGSANSYAMAAQDSISGNRFFTMTLSNAGGAASDFPPNQQIESGAFGSMPYSGMQWAMYCGGKDPDPNINGCPAMTKAKDWVVKYGATMTIFIEDANGDHGGFHTNPANVEAVLAKFVPVNRYADVDKIFDWAEKTYPGSLSPAAVSKLGYGYYYRCYTGGVCLGAKNDSLFLYQAGQLKPVGKTADYLAGIR